MNERVPAAGRARRGLRGPLCSCAVGECALCCVLSRSELMLSLHAVGSQQGRVTGKREWLMGGG